MIDTQTTIADYHASEAVSHSKLRTFAADGPLAYYARHVVRSGTQPVTDAMRFGQTFEDFVQLPPADFKRKYREITDERDKDTVLAECIAAGVTQEDGTPFTKRHGVATMELALLRKAGGDAIKRGDMQRIERMADAFMRNERVQTVLRGLAPQVTLRREWPGLPHGIQARPDWCTVDEFASRSTVDLKVVSNWGRHDSSGADLVRDMINRGAHTQAAFIDLITGAADRLVVAVEADFPYRCQLVYLDELLPLGAAWCRRQLDAVRDCYARDNWSACEPVMYATAPAWARKGSDE